ncbi:MAG: FGGY-family carbohydrate kinase [Candidatus Bathyarchaeia archaeon]|nr:carbohydrate kinase [Candidatus Bathyarchaeota archaeon]
MAVGNYLMGIDAGCTTVKTVIFSLQGREVAVAREKLPNLHPAPGRVERDMEALWSLTKEVIIRALKMSNIPPREILGLGVSGHGDGLYLLDEDGEPVRNGVLSLDSRSSPLVKRWEEDGIVDEVFPIIGQRLHACSPSSILAWMKHEEEGSYNRARWILFCKDFIKFKLTNVICTDETDPSASLVNVRTRKYADEIFETLGIEECKGKLPEIIPGWRTCGEVTAQASRETGLMEGTPVASGLHDIDATALGSGCLENGQMAMIIGTWTINEVIQDRPLLDPMKLCQTRTFGAPDRWLLLNADPASAANLDWFIEQFCDHERLRAERLGISPHVLCDGEVETVEVGAGGIIYHPFLYGSLDMPKAKAGFYGIAGWHGRAHLLRALYEGIAFATNMCVENLKRVTEIKEVRIAGGGARSKIWTQIFSDVTGYPIGVPDGTELGARGAAMCAGISIGVYKDHRAAVREATSISRRHVPKSENEIRYKSIYSKFKDSIRDASRIWDRLQQK